MGTLGGGMPARRAGIAAGASQQEAQADLQVVDRATAYGEGRSVFLSRLATPAASREREREPVERRGNRRYAMNLAMRYEIAGKELGPQFGEGRVVNMSSGGILIETDCILRAGLPIRIRIEWPARLNDGVPLALHIEGRTVRAHGKLAALIIRKSDFRTRPMCRAAGAMPEVG